MLNFNRTAKLMADIFHVTYKDEMNQELADLARAEKAHKGHDCFMWGGELVCYTCFPQMAKRFSWIRKPTGGK